MPGCSSASTLGDLLSEARRSALRLVLVYTAFSTCWIVFSDWMLAGFHGTPFNFVLWNIGKGLLFVGLTSVLLYVMALRFGKNLASKTAEFAFLTEQAKDIVLLCDPALNMVYINPALQQLCGRPLDALLGKPVAGILTETQAMTLEAHVEALRIKPFVRQEWLVRSTDGMLVPLDVTTQRLADGRYLAIGANLSESRKAQQEIEVERQRLKTLLRSIPDPLWLKNTAGAYIACNPAMARVMGLAEEQIIGHRDHDLLPACYADDFVTSDHQVITTGLPITYSQSFKGADGELGYYKTTKAPVLGIDGQLLGVFGLARDVSSEYQAKEALSVSERQFRALFEAATDAIFVTDINANFINVNKSACEMLGYSKEEFMRMRVMDIETEVSLEEIQRGINSEEIRHGLTIRGRNRRKDGTVFPVEVKVGRFETDKQVGSIAIVRDITARQHAEDALRASEEFNRAVLNASVSQMAVLKSDGEIVATNESWRQFSLKNSSAALPEPRTGIGTNFLEICRSSVGMHADEAIAAMDGVKAVLDGKLASFSLECPCDTLEQHRWFMMNVTPLKLGAGGAVVAYLDITGIKKTQELQDRLARQFKALARKELDIMEEERHRLSMELHDHVGQTLAALQMLLFDCSSQLRDSPPGLETVARAMNVVDGLVESIRDISRRLRPLMLDDLGLVSAIRWHIDKLPLPEGVRVQFEEHIGAGRFPSAIELAGFRVVQEALSNALRHAEASRIVVSVFLSQERLCLTVRDNGKGFDTDRTRQNAQHLLSLGLIGMRERVVGLGGEFVIISQPGAGAEVSISLPASNLP